MNYVGMQHEQSTALYSFLVW